MAVFGGMTLTNKGLVLQGKAQAGAQLNYTRIAVGDGSLTGQSIPALNGLLSPKKSLPIARVNIIPPNKVTVGTVLRNADVTAGFYWREVGVFAQDPDAGEILYAYANAGVTADYIPPGGGADIIEKAFDCIVVVGTATNITAVIDDSLVFAKKSELDALDAAKVDKVSGKGLSANDYTTAEKNKLANIAAGAGGANTATDTVIGDRTIADAGVEPTGQTGKLGTLLNWLAFMIKSITGKSSWRTAPATTLEAAKAHADDTTRHLSAAERTAWNAKETTAGAQAKADAVQANLATHAGNTTVHVTAAERSAWNAKADASQLGRVDLTQTLGPGTSVIQADQNGSELDLVVQGRTLVNLLGSYGDGESLNGWILSGINPVLNTTTKRSGTSSYKFAATAVGGASVMVKDFYIPLDVTKSYVVLAWVYIESADISSGGRTVMYLRDVGTTSARYSASAIMGRVGVWQLVYIKVPVNNTLVGSGFRLYLGHTTPNDFVFYMDEVRLYEVSAVEYAAIGTTMTDDTVDLYFPQVSGKQHVQGVAVTEQGKNLFSLPYTSASTNVVYVEDRSSNSITATSGGTIYNYVISKRFPVVPNTTYTLSANLTNVSGPDNPQISVRKGSDTGASGITAIFGTGKKSISFNSGTETEIILFAYASVATAAVQTKRYEFIQLELGSEATPFTPAEPQSVILPVTLGQIGEVRDSVYSQGIDWMCIERIKKDIALDGSLPWNFTNTYTGYKRLNALLPAPAARIGGIFQRAIKYTGVPLTHLAVAPTAADQFLVYDNNNVYLSVAGTDSGWIDAVNPSNNAIKALMNGWKASANDGSAYTSWVSMIDGSAPVTNTSTYVAANKAPGWTAWATLDYVLAQAAAPVPVPNAEGSITLHPGGNQINVETGVIQREKVVPKLDSGNYYIISQSSGSYWGKAVLSRPTQKFLAVFKGAENDTRNWIFTPDGLGAINARALPANFDTSADYYVTYIVLDKYSLTANVTETAATWRTGLGGVVSDVVQSVAELRQDNDRQDFADDYIEAKVDNLKLGITDGSVLPDTIQKYKLTEKTGKPFIVTSGSVDALTSTGLYYISTTSNVSGFPSDIGTNTAVTLEVLELGVTSSNKSCLQRVTAYASVRVWQRRYNGTDWTAWVESENGSKKNVAWGYAGLDGSGDVSLTAIPDAVQKYSLTKDDGKALALASGTDLNTVLTTGFYSGNFLLNAPGGSQGWFHVLVQTHSGTADGLSYVFQKAILLSATGTQLEWLRRRVSNTWETWVSIPNSSIYNVANGLAGLDSAANVPVDNLPFGSVTNMLGDSGRFVGPDSNPAAISCSNTFANIPFFSSWNGTTVTGAGKFYHDNSTNGGSSGALTADVSSLLTAMYGGTGVRYGTEFHIASYTMGSGTSSPNSTVPTTYLMTANSSFPAGGVGKSFTVSFWIRVKSGTKVVINKEARLKKNATAQATHLQITPADGWMHIETVISAAPGYANGAPNIYATPGDVVQIALPVVVAGGIGVGVHNSPVMGANLGFVPLPASTYTASDVLSKLITVDGAGSGLDADLHAGKTLADVVQGSLSYLGTIAGSSPNFTGTANPAIAALAPGQRLSFKALQSTSGPITLNVNGLGAKSIKKPNGNNPPLVQGGVYTVIYDGQAFILQGEGGEYGTATAAQVLTGYTVGREDGIVAGSMPYVFGGAPATYSYSAWNNGLDVKGPNGYHGPTSSLSITDNNFVANNIPDDVSIFGLVGALKRMTSAEKQALVNAIEGKGVAAGMFDSVGVLADKVAQIPSYKYSSGSANIASSYLWMSTSGWTAKQILLSGSGLSGGVDVLVTGTASLLSPGYNSINWEIKREDNGVVIATPTTYCDVTANGGVMIYTPGNISGTLWITVREAYK